MRLGAGAAQEAQEGAANVHMGSWELTADMFKDYLNALFKEENVRRGGAVVVVEIATATRWLHDLGFGWGKRQKGYCDGHEKPEIVADRVRFCTKYVELMKRMHLWCEDPDTGEVRCVDDYKLGNDDGELDRLTLGEFGGKPHPDAGVSERDPDPGKRPLKVVNQDECIAKQNTENHGVWTEEGKAKLVSKTHGQGRMISGVVDELEGMLEDKVDKAILDKANRIRNKRVRTLRKRVCIIIINCST